MTDFGDIWRPVTKGGAYPAHYFRKKHVARSSKKVAAVNAAFGAAATACKGNKTSDKSFQNCIKGKLKGKTY